MPQNDPAARSYTAEQPIEAAASTVWALLSDLGNVEMAAGFAGIHVEGRGTGAVRTLMLPEPNGGAISERIETFDPDRRSYSYRVLTFGPLPFAAYQGVLTVRPIDSDASVLHYQAIYVPSHDDDDSCGPIAAGSFAQLVANLNRILKA